MKKLLSSTYENCYRRRNEPISLATVQLAYSHAVPTPHGLGSALVQEHYHTVLVAAVRASLKSAPFVYVRGFYIFRRRSVICFRFPVIAFNYRARRRIVTHSFRW